MAQRVALLSDTHGVLDPRIAELVAACDMAVHAGDIGDAGVIRQLRPRSGVVIAVRGNNDPAILRGTGGAVPVELPECARIALPGGTLIAVHGHLTNPAKKRHELLRARHREARAVVYGHSHRMTCDTESLPWILNPGAAGRARTHGGPSCLILRAGGSGWTVEAVRFPLRG